MAAALTLAAPTALAVDTQILWQTAGELSAQVGAEANIGTAGVVVGSSNGFVIVGGGANFPSGSPAENGIKVTYPDVYVLKVTATGTEEVDHQVMPYPIGYGASISIDDKVYYFGGSTDPEGAKAVTEFSADKDGKLSYKQLAPLTFAFQNGIAAYNDGKVYLGVGSIDGKTSSRLVSYDLASGEIAELAAFPGEERSQSVAQFLNGKLYLFSGGDKVAYTDGYSYDPKTNEWSKVSDVVVKDKAISLLGAGSVKLNEEEMLVLGGFNKEVWDWAVSNLGTLKDDELQAFRQKYFTSSPLDFRWNKEILVYNATFNSWRSLGEIPFLAPCGAGVVLANNYLLSINGEIKPATRINRIYQGFFIEAK